MKRLFWFIAIVSLSMHAQDYHLSFFTETNTTINPAATGSFPGAQRAFLSFRDQWRSLGTPFSTYLGSVDIKLNVNNESTGFLALGAQVISDQIAAGSMSSLKSSLLVAYHVLISKNSILSAGLMGSYLQMKISQEQWSWHNQFTGNGFDPSLPSGENITSDKSSAGDVSVGLMYSYLSSQSSLAANDGVKLHVGLAYHHINQPKIDFTSAEKSGLLHSKLVLHSRSQIGIPATNTSFIPEAMFALQGPARQSVLGLGARFMMKEESQYTNFVKGSAFTLGAKSRLGDALCPYLLIEVGHITMGFVYDINISSLRQATNGKGAFEFFIQYINPNPFKGKESRSFY